MYARVVDRAIREENEEEYKWGGSYDLQLHGSWRKGGEGVSWWWAIDMPSPWDDQLYVDTMNDDASSARVVPIEEKESQSGEAYVSCGWIIKFPFHRREGFLSFS